MRDGRQGFEPVTVISKFKKTFGYDIQNIIYMVWCSGPKADRGWECINQAVISGSQLIAVSKDRKYNWFVVVGILYPALSSLE